MKKPQGVRVDYKNGDWVEFWTKSALRMQMFRHKTKKQALKDDSIVRIHFIVDEE